MAPTIGLLGDVMLGRKVGDELARIPPADVWSAEMRELCAGCDVVIGNLECCISERGTPTTLIAGKPFFFRAPPQAVDALAAAGITAVGTANNHALDYGPDALLDTLGHLDGARIGHAGAGADLMAARRGLVVEAGGLALGLLSLSDHPREYAASGDSPGIAHADLRRELPGWAAGELHRLREHADLVIAFPHWGPNMTVRPEPWQRLRADELLRAGADLVAGHSAHTFHGFERHPGGLALYDLGDALDDYRVDDLLRNDLGVLALWRPGRSPELELVGLRLDYCHTRLAAGADAEWIHERLEQACGELGTGVERLGEQRFAPA